MLKGWSGTSGKLFLICQQRRRAFSPLPLYSLFQVQSEPQGTLSPLTCMTGIGKIGWEAADEGGPAASLPVLDSHIYANILSSQSSAPCFTAAPTGSV